MQKVLFIGVHWPEPSTGAGTRIMQLIKVFLSANYEVIFATTATESNLSYPLEDFKVQKAVIELNNASFDVFITNLQPNLVIFDRFLMEEQFGWRVAENVPSAVRILDTEDLHSLRTARFEAFKKNSSFSIDLWLENDVTKREIASIYRSDLSLIISNYEIQLLKDNIKIDESLLLHLPFMVENSSKIEIDNFPVFENRKNFICIGNGKHAPNVDAVIWLKTAIWPLIKKQLPESNVYIYGAYMPQQILQMHQPKNGFYVLDYAKDLKDIFTKSKVNLAPLRFGAGLKGKLIDAMRFGTPSVTTSIGSEGMTNGLHFNGMVADDEIQFANAAVTLYTNKEEFSTAQQNGFKIVNTNFDAVKLSKKLVDNISNIQQNIVEHRKANFIGSLLRHQTLQSTKYMAKWIEEKNNEDKSLKSK